MTNILATITFVIVTNWTTVSITYPAAGKPNEQGYMNLVYYPIIENQQGTIVSNTVLHFDWHGKQVETTVASETVNVISRRVDANTRQELWR